MRPWEGHLASRRPSFLKGDNPTRLIGSKDRHYYFLDGLGRVWAQRGAVQDFLGHIHGEKELSGVLGLRKAASLGDSVPKGGKGTEDALH